MSTSLKRIDHIAIVVDELASARRFLTETLGFSHDRHVSIPETSVEADFMTLHGTSIELIEVSDASQRAKRLGAGAMARIEHIALEVDDLERTVAALKDRGVLMTTEVAIVRPGTRSYFTRPETSHGVMYQIFERAASS